MRNNIHPNFSQIICSSRQVRTAFAEHGPTRFWWRLILVLHGKPVAPSLSQAESTKRVADGFHFYAGLYRCLSVILLLSSCALFAVHHIDNSVVSTYWGIASLGAAVYLWFVSGLGYVGARCYNAGEPQGISALVAFMVMIIAFLSLFVATVSVVVHHCVWLPTRPNLLASGALFVFGIGSYMIEIIYLATEREMR